VEVDLLGEERVALALGVDATHQGGRGPLPGEPGHQGGHALLGQRPQADPGHQPLAHELVEDAGQRRGRLDLVVPEGTDDQRPALVPGAVADQDPEPAGVGLGVDLLGQPGLADPGLARDQHQRAVPDAGVLDRPAQVGPLPLALDERGLDRPDRPAGVVASPLRLKEPPAVGEPRSQ
jgi:hypothetical protein